MLPSVDILDFRVRLPMDRRPANARSKPPEYTERYDHVLAIGDRRYRDVSELLTDMDEAGVARAVVHAEYEYGDPANSLNEAVAAMVAGSSRFWGFGTISFVPLYCQQAIKQVSAVADLGLIGLNLQPSFFDVPIDDRRLYPVYAKALELGLVVSLHVGVNYVHVKPMELGHPARVDRIACDFPDLKLVACHAGWPWVPEIIAVARRHPNVYLEFGGMAPKYVGEPGTGWEVMRRYMDSLLADRVLFGSDWPTFPIHRAIHEWRSMGLKEHTYRNLMRDNLLSILGSSNQLLRDITNGS